MSPAVATCAACGHVFAEQDALDPCPRCGGTERTLRRESLVVDRGESGEPTEALHVEEREPDGSVEIVEEPIEGPDRERPGG